MENRNAVQLLQELSVSGRRGSLFPECDVPVPPTENFIPPLFLSEGKGQLPELAEGDVIRHYTNLSRRNMSVDTHFYPLGSCTMKYNPKRHERWAGYAGLGDVHPWTPAPQIQGLLEILYEMQQMLGEIAGLPAVSVHPAAGAHGEYAALLTARAYFEAKGENRRKVIFPASAHGTNPASASMAGFDCLQLKPSANGYVNIEDLQQQITDDIAVFMVTNPNTLGLFEGEISKISQLIHAAGGLVYIDGANMNAILGKTRPGDFGGDMMHYNVHKTFTGPHGAGGPGSGPIAVRDFLGDYLPGPVIVKEMLDGKPFYDIKNPKCSVGRLRSFLGNIGILLRGYFYIRSLGAKGLREASEHAVLNANYLLAELKDVFKVPHGDRCMHEFVASAAGYKSSLGITAMDIAKRLIDYGFHAPTVYFPLVVSEAIMIEPTETESKATLDSFVQTLKQILTEDPEFLHQAPYHTPVTRPDEVKAAREPILTYCPCAAPLVETSDEKDSRQQRPAEAVSV